jgi:hypothetical protein
VLNIPVLLAGGLLQEFHQIFFFCGLALTPLWRSKRNCDAPGENCFRQSFG